MADDTLVAPDFSDTADPREPRSARPRRGGKAALEWIALHAFAIAAALFFVLPFVFVFLTAVMTDQQTLTRDLWPDTWQWHNIVTVWNEMLERPR